MAFGGLNIGDLLLTLLADGSMLQKDIEKQGVSAANKAGPVIGQSLGAAIGAGLTKSGKQMATIGKGLTQNLTVPIVAAGTAITLVGVKFDTTLRKIVALTDVTADEIGMVKDAILELAPAIGKSPQELAEAFYYLASGGFNAKEALDILGAAGRAAAAGLGETQDVAKVIGASINAFGKEELSATMATDQLIRAIKDGTAEAPDFAGALGDVVGSAGLVGATFGDTAGAIAAMTLQGISADESATSLNQIFRALIKTTPIANKAFAEVGLTVDGLRQQLKEKGLLSLLQTLDERFAGNEVAAANAFREVRALRGVLALVGDDNLESSTRILEDIANGTTTLASAFKETAGPGRAIDKALAQIQVTLISLSEDVLPIAVELIQEFADVLGKASRWFKELPPGTRKTIIEVAALTAALGPLVWVSGKVVQGLGGIVTGLSKLAGSRAVKAIGTSIVAPIVHAFTGLGAKIAASSAVQSGMAALGTLMGTKVGLAISAGATAALAAAPIAITYVAIEWGKAEQAKSRAEIADAVEKVLAEGTREGMEAARADLVSRLPVLENAASSWFTMDKDGAKEALANTKAQIAALETALSVESNAAGERAGRDFALGWTSGVGGSNFVGPVLDTKRITATAEAAGKMIPQSLAHGIIKAQNEPVDAMANLKFLMKNALTPAKRIARDIGILTSRQLARGLKDKRSVVRDEARRVRDVAEQDLAKLILGGGNVGREAAAELARKLKSKNPQVRNAAKRVKAIVNEELAKTKKGAGEAGADAGKEFIRRLKAAMVSGDFKVNAYVGFTIPGRATGGPVAANMPYLVNENTARSELFVPSTSGHVLTHTDAMEAAGRAGGTSSVTYNIPVAVTGLVRARDPLEIATQLRRFAALGVLGPKETLR